MRGIMMGVKRHCEPEYGDTVRSYVHPGQSGSITFLMRNLALTDLIINGFTNLSILKFGFYQKNIGGNTG